MNFLYCSYSVIKNTSWERFSAFLNATLTGRISGPCGEEFRGGLMTVISRGAKVLAPRAMHHLHLLQPAVAEEEDSDFRPQRPWGPGNKGPGAPGPLSGYKRSYHGSAVSLPPPLQCCAQSVKCSTSDMAYSRAILVSRLCSYFSRLVVDYQCYSFQQKF